MDEIRIFRELVETASRQPLEIGDMREAIRRAIAKAERAAPLPGPLAFPLMHDVFFRTASAAMATIVVGLGLGYYDLVRMASEWALGSPYPYYEMLSGLSIFWGVF